MATKYGIKELKPKYKVQQPSKKLSKSAVKDVIKGKMAALKACGDDDAAGQKLKVRWTVKKSCISLVWPGRQQRKQRVI